MPEGDVVLRTARRLDAALAGRVLTASDLRWPSLATVDLRGREVKEVRSAGKHLLTRVGGELTLHSHLRMEGSWHVHHTGGRRGARSPDGIRAVLANADWTAVGHRLGMLDLVPTSQEHTLVGHLGPDVLAPSWDPEEVRRRMRADPARPVGEVLLDQRVLAGMGTFFVCEALFVRGVTPWTPVAEVDAAPLLDLVHRLMVLNVERAVQVTTGDAGRGQEQWVHARSGRPCRRCGTTIRMAAIGPAPQDRVAFYCPACQKGPAPTDPGGTQRPLGAPSPLRSGARRGYGGVANRPPAGP